MKKFGVGLVSIVLAQSLNAIVAEHWWQLAEKYSPPNPPPQTPELPNPLVIYENSTLNVETNQQGLGWDLWVAGIKFDHDLDINVRVIGAVNGMTSIYSLGQKQQTITEGVFEGVGKLNVMVDSAGANPTQALFHLNSGNKLTFDVKTHIATTENSRVSSIFRNAGKELNFNNDLIVDLSKAIGTFTSTDVPTSKLIFDNTGIINVNPNNNAIIQLTGDIVNFGGGVINLNFSSADSFFNGKITNFGDLNVNLSNEAKFNVVNLDNKSKLSIVSNNGAFFNGNITNPKELNVNLNNGALFSGKLDVSDEGQARFELSNKARAEFDLKLESIVGQTPTFTMNLSNDSIAKVKVEINSEHTNSTFSVLSNSLLYVDFNYTFTGVNEADRQTKITLEDGGVLLPNQNLLELDTVDVKNPSEFIVDDKLKSLKGLSAVDMRFEKQGEVLRDVRTYDKTTRYKLKTKRIDGGGGIFRLTGVLNQVGWGGKEGFNNDETIATDQIITEAMSNTPHHIQLFWNNNTLDKSLINKDLSEYKIVVAKQNNPAEDTDFIGAVTPIGVYNYITNLEKEKMEFLDAQNVLNEGRRWIVKDVQRADNSYLSRLLDSAFQTQYRIFKMESDSFNQRMGELRDMQRVHGVWLRVKYGRLNSKSTSQTLGSWDEFTTVQAGYDQNYTVLGGKNFFGLAFDTTAFGNNGNAEKDDLAHKSYYGGSRTYGFSLYDTYIFDNGVYIDALAKYYLVDQYINIYSEVLSGNRPKFISHGLVGSLEIGKKFRLPIKTPDFQNSFYYLRPEFQFTFGFTSGTSWDFKDWTNQIVRSRLDFNLPANFRTGLMFGREFNKSYVRGEVYLGTSIEYDINTGGDLRLEDFIDKMTLSHKGNFNWRINAGTNLILNEYWRLYFDIDASFFGKINSTFTLNGGVRINFGQLHPRMPYITPDQEGSFGDSLEKYRKDRRTIPEVQNYETYGIINNGKMNKRPAYKPPVKIKKRVYGGDVRVPDPIPFGVSPQVKQPPQGEVQFIDDGTPQAPQKNYKRDENQPILQTPQRNREMQGIKERLNQGFKQ